MIARSLALGEKKKQDLSWNVRNFLAFGTREEGAQWPPEVRSSSNSYTTPTMRPTPALCNVKENYPAMSSLSFYIEFT